MYITRLASNEIFSPSNKTHREVGRAKDLPAPLYQWTFRMTIQDENSVPSTIIAIQSWTVVKMQQ